MAPGIVFLLYQKGRDSRIFQAQDRRDRRFHVERKTKGTAVLTNPNLYVKNDYYLSVAIRLCVDLSRVRPVSTRLKEAEARFAGYITRDDCSAPVRGADPLRQKRAHAQRPASRADRRLDPRIWLHQPGADRRRGRHYRRRRPGARRAFASTRCRASSWRTSRRRSAAPMCSPTTSWRSTPAGISRCSRSKLASWAKRGSTSASPALTSSNSASYSPRGPKVGPIPTMLRSLPRTRSRRRATYGCSAAIACSAATAQWRPTLSACSVASRRTLWSPTRPTALITTRLGHKEGHEA